MSSKKKQAGEFIRSPVVCQEWFLDSLCHPTTFSTETNRS